ncbi:MAG: sulfotransferase [Anaerolineae bacterium]|nr:sulfotransferase [Anaerolineae bacterium]
MIELSLSENLKKYVRYVLNRPGFEPRFGNGRMSERALQAAQDIRGRGRKPALIVHGIMPRAGTVYVGELLRLHPDLYAYPYQLWEVPFLQLGGDLDHLQREFLLGYRHNIDKLEEHDFLPVFGAALLAYLNTNVGDDKRTLLKVPSVQYLHHFFDVFPHENLLVLVRDGRDIVQSTINTWPQLRFSIVCRRWRASAEMVLACDRHFAGRPGYALARYEDSVADPAGFVKRICDKFCLDESRYPYERIGEIGVHGSSSIQGESSDRVNWDAVPKPGGFHPVGRWQAWSAGKRHLFKHFAGQALMDLGYCENQNW